MNNDDSKPQKSLAVWALTPNGVRLARRILTHRPDANLFVSEKRLPDAESGTPFHRLKDAVRRHFAEYKHHIFIMSTGIVVRTIAPLICHKIKDPAVVVMDELGCHAISLLSGHLGGANRLATEISEAIRATPVITTATDLNQLPSIDVIAKDKGLGIENPTAIRHVSMALLNSESVGLHDPFGILSDMQTDIAGAFYPVTPETDDMPIAEIFQTGTGVFIDDRVIQLPNGWLRLRPGSLVAGIGCNRGTEMAEMRDLLQKTLAAHKLAIGSLSMIASADLKKDETGLLELADTLSLPTIFYDRDALNRVKKVRTPSPAAMKHIGVQSVCEAAALLGSDNGELVVEKHKTRNVTVAIARRSQFVMPGG